ncbi:hypothetical protein [Geomicrobium sp. JCM 19038]|uniref:DUF7667 family protein n=1 Tax=Geomicrobium sp. JCM 19038 TaxID=1460635 RepID=UPI00045F477A|nr:hypothetical protein [Geomicrobium sp. JCM 19038]GAK10151.1 hypothetical protein JCM19038_4036 [Geomicrobium sp. JCM 19038]
MIGMYSAVSERFLRLILEKDYRPLTEMERAELNESKTYLQNYYWEKEKLQAMSYLAYATEDDAWQKTIHEQVDRLNGH